jgi:hypothetical protein
MVASFRLFSLTDSDFIILCSTGIKLSFNLYLVCSNIRQVMKSMQHSPYKVRIQEPISSESDLSSN